MRWRGGIHFRKLTAEVRHCDGSKGIERDGKAVLR